MMARSEETPRRSRQFGEVIAQAFSFYRSDPILGTSTDDDSVRHMNIIAR